MYLLSGIVYSNNYLPASVINKCSIGDFDQGPQNILIMFVIHLLISIDFQYLYMSMLIRNTHFLTHIGNVHFLVRSPQ